MKQSADPIYCKSEVKYEMQIKRMTPRERARYAVFGMIGLIFIIFEVRHSRHLNAIQVQIDQLLLERNNRGEIHYDQDSPKVPPQLKQQQLIPSNELPFQVDIKGEKYPTIADFSHAQEGVYNGIPWKLACNNSPRALMLYNMISTDDANEIIKEASDELSRSEIVHDPGQTGVSNVRTSFGMWIRNPINANIKLRKKAASIVGVPPENMELTQVLRYYPGQYYRLHPDYFARQAKSELARGGQRFATVLTWLNPIGKGGETYFPLAKPEPLKVKQTGVGNSVLFYSMTHDAQDDPGSQHEAIAPEEGSMKWVAVIWIRQHEFA